MLHLCGNDTKYEVWNAKISISASFNKKFVHKSWQNFSESFLKKLMTPRGVSSQIALNLIAYKMAPK